MEFTYRAYEHLIDTIFENGYEIVSYKDWQDKARCVILRNDIDNDIGKALELAKHEKKLGVKSTYFVLVTSDFYNVFSLKNQRLLQEISDCGHDIGLHFDEVRYPDISTPEDAKRYIMEEAKLLSGAIGKKVDTVSMHRPSKMMLETDLHIPDMINSYGKVYFKEFKYVSDSRRRWREPVTDIIQSGSYERLHILTHAIWYNETEKNIHDSICDFVNAGNLGRYEAEAENITDLESIMSRSEIR